MSWLIEIENLQELEDNREWKEILILLEGLWNNNKNNVDIMSRVASECWYILVEWRIQINSSDIDYERVKTLLIQITENFLKQPNKEIKDLCLFGYMITLFPHLFYKEEVKGAYSKWEDIGDNLLSEAYKLDRDNSIINIIYKDKILDEEQYVFHKKKIIDTIDNYFTAKTMFERYFREMLLMK